MTIVEILRGASEQRGRIVGVLTAIIAGLSGCWALPTAQDAAPGASETTGCLVCHNELEAVLAKKFKHAAVEMGCEMCHSDHGDPSTGIGRGPVRLPHSLREPVNALCAGCHAETLEGKRYVHAPAATSCTACHDPHGSDFASNLHAPLNELCLECHGDNALRLMTQIGPMSLYGGRTILPEGVYKELRFLRLSQRGDRGHPTFNHPVKLAAQQGKPAITCVTCHKPHASETSPLFYVTETLGSTALCITCHK